MATLLAAVCLAAPGAVAQNRIFDSRIMAPFVPTPELVVQRMLALADLKPADTLYDLGSGDGRILFTAAESFGSSAVGIEISKTLVEQTRNQAAVLELSERVTVLQQDLLQADLTQATVVTVYLLSSSNEQLRPKLEKELKPGTRVVSHDFQFKGWTPKATEEVTGSGRVHCLYLYEMPGSGN
jgi:16S rRNA A1518/A1519 N6-dimethyltransferase RsmA/KsgA/DIM1 with predicted DNA glycosylase/AP lyase activity